MNTSRRGEKSRIAFTTPKLRLVPVVNSRIYFHLVHYVLGLFMI